MHVMYMRYVHVCYVHALYVVHTCYVDARYVHAHYIHARYVHARYVHADNVHPYSVYLCYVTDTAYETCESSAMSCQIRCSQTQYKTQMGLYDFPNHAYFNSLYHMSKGNV